MPATLLIILSLPLVVISNTVISRKEVVFWYGGFFTVYHRRVGWMSLSVMHLFSLVFAIFTILISSMLIYRTLPSNLNSSIERSLFINSSFSAFGLILQASFQSYYGLFRYQTWFPQWIIHSQFVFYDFMTVGCPLMMVLSANEFRSQLFYCCEESTTKTTEYIEFQSLSKAKKGGGSRRRINENPSIHFDSLA
uniref:Serpentine receptor class gamma n=1 Tax=Caenorhabditis tropicalis TaxID=1561998 RepID=A0A1I7U2X8_9PELO